MELVRSRDMGNSSACWLPLHWLSCLILMFAVGCVTATRDGRDSQSAACANSVVCVSQQTAGDRQIIKAANFNYFPITLGLYRENDDNDADRTLLKVVAVDPFSYSEILNQPKPADAWKFKLHWFWQQGRVDAKHDDRFIYGRPFSDTAPLRITEGPFEKRTHDGQFAVDFAMPEGTPVLAARGGLVVSSMRTSVMGGANSLFSDLGNFICIMHEDGTYAFYFHLQVDGVLVSPGERVEKGAKIGLSGNTGFSTGPHLHFQVSAAKSDKESRPVPVVFGPEIEAALKERAGRVKAVGDGLCERATKTV